MSLCQSEVGMGCAERVALCTLRRALRGEVGLCTSLVCPFGLGRDSVNVQKLFADIWVEEVVPPALQDISLWKTTKIERRLLRALAAAQAENDDLLNRYLLPFVPSWPVRQRLAMAMEALAATLAVHGYWLQQPLDLLPIPGSVLMLLRAQGRDLAMAQVSWPSHAV